jgi:hypothetical protein
MKFIPDENGQDYDIPFFDQVSSKDGWKGQSTDKSVETLRAEISAEIGRMHGTMTGWLRGEYETENGGRRPGIEIRYQVVTKDGNAYEGRIAIAALPYEVSEGRADSDRINRTRADKSLRMGLFNVRDALQSSRIMETLSPGYAALMPWLLVAGNDGLTVSEMWAEHGMGQRALPVPDEDGDIVEGEIREVD